MPDARPSPRELRARMADIDRDLATIHGCDAAVLDRRDALEAEHRGLWHTLYTHGEDPPRRNNGWGKH